MEKCVKLNSPSLQKKNLNKAKEILFRFPLQCCGYAQLNIARDIAAITK